MNNVEPAGDDSSNNTLNCNLSYTVLVDIKLNWLACGRVGL